VAGIPDPVTGMAVDLAALDERVERLVLDEVDHHKLEDAPALSGVITTGESLARAFWRILAPAVVPAGSLRRVSVVETAKNRFEYRGESE
jgi:6-pyruvoyl-tetrahydropterin synthase